MADFTGKRCITCGINNEIPAEMQNILWGMIDNDRMQGKILDYLQVFTLKPVFINGEIKQKIIHEQEQPRRRVKTIIENIRPISAKIFVIDDTDYVTMLLNHEY